MNQPDQNQIEKINLINQLANHFLENLIKIAPDSREKSIAITKMEECLMWAQQGILRHPTATIQIIPAGSIKQ